jgi:hypothetical protein
MWSTLPFARIMVKSGRKCVRILFAAVPFSSLFAHLFFFFRQLCTRSCAHHESSVTAGEWHAKESKSNQSRIKLIAHSIDPGNSHVTEVEQGGNLVLECSFQVESVPDNMHSQSEIRWMWHGRSISNNSEGVLSSQRFTIHEFDYFLTGPTDHSWPTDRPISTTVNSDHLSTTTARLLLTSGSALSGPNQDGVRTEARDFEPIRESDSNELKAIDRQTIDTFEMTPPPNDLTSIDSSATSAVAMTTAKSLKSADLEPSESFGSYQVSRRRMRKSRLEITFMLELNQGVYTCEAVNAAGHSAANFTVKVGPARHASLSLPSSSSASLASQSLTKHSRQQADQGPSVDRAENQKPPNAASLPVGESTNDSKSGKRDGATHDGEVGEDLIGTAVATGSEPQSPKTSSGNDRLINANNSIFFGLLLGILFGILLVLLVFSLLIIFLCRKKDAVDDLPNQVIACPASVGGSCTDLGLHLGPASSIHSMSLGNASLVHPITSLSACAGDLHSLDTGHLIAQYGYLTNSQFLGSDPIYKSLGSVRIESLPSEKY